MSFSVFSGTCTGTYGGVKSVIQNVSFPACTSIGDRAFYSCTALTTASFPACTSINQYAFGGCTSLSEASFPACTSIGSSAFQLCTSLTTANFPACTTIGSYAFYGCTSLSEVSFPACKAIGNYAFYSCTALTTANFEQYFMLISSIGSLNFYRSSYLQNLRIGTSSIAIRTFSECTRLTSLTLTSTGVANLGNSNAFTSTPIAGYSDVVGQYGSIYVPASLLANYKASTNWTYFSARMVGF